MQPSQQILRGKTVLITGGTGGIGKETARGLAKLGATVVIVGRDVARGQAAVHDLQTTTGNSAIHLLTADVAHQAEIHRLARQIMQQFDHLDVLVNNVAAVYRQRRVTPDGIEATFAVGHLAPFLLTHLLLPMLETSPAARIVNVSSEGHSMAKLDFKDLQAEHFYRGIDIYTRVKLANLLFTYELSRRLAGRSITVNAVDPGGAHTHLTNSTTSDMLPPLMKILFPLVARFAFTSAEKAAESSIYAASAPELAGVSGKYFSIKLKEIKSSKESYDVAAAQKLWRISEDLTKTNTDLKRAV